MWCFKVLFTFLIPILLSLAAPNTVLTEIKLLNLFYTPGEGVDQIRAYLEGFLSVIDAAGGVTEDGRTITVIDKEVGDTGSDVVATVQTALNNHPDLLAVVGPYSDERLVALLMSGILSTNKLMALSPVTGSSAIRTYNDFVYFLRADPATETLVLLQYITASLNVRRIGFMYITGVSFGDDELKLIRTQLASMGRDDVVTYESSGYRDSLDEAKFDAFANHNLQAIIVYGLPGSHVREFVNRCLTDSRTKDAVLLGTAALTDVLYSVFTSQVNTNTSFTPNEAHLILSSTNLLPSETSYKHIQEFQADMDNFIQNGGSTFGDPQIYTNQPNLGELMVAGWVAGKVILKTINNPSWSKTREAYQKGLFEQNRYIVGEDFVVGDFGGPCASSVAEGMGAVCSCNQGGRTTFLKTVNADLTISALPGTEYTYPSSKCYSNDETMPAPVAAVLMNIVDDQRLSMVYPDVFRYFTMVATAATKITTKLRFSMFRVDVTEETFTPGLEKYYTEHVADILSGPMVFSGRTRNRVFIEPMFSVPQLNERDQNTIFLTPTIDQQTYVLYSYLAKELEEGVFTDISMSCLMKRMESRGELMKENIRKTAITFGLKEPTQRLLSVDEDLSKYMESAGTTIIMGFDTNDVTTIADFMDSNPEAKVIFIFSDFALNYEAISNTFSTRSARTQARLVTLTNFPNWLDTRASALEESANLKMFQRIFSNPNDRTPLAMQALIACKFIQQLSETSEKVNYTNMKTTLYRNSMFVMDDLQFGPYVKCEDSSVVGEQENCVPRNYGARDIRIVNFLGLLHPDTVDPLHPPMTPSMVYTEPEPEKSKLSTGQIVGIAVGCAAFVLLLIAAIILIVCCCCSGSRNNKTAPKKLSEPVTLIFTDIESSTALWAAAPTLMPDAVATHHKLIRQLIQKYKCYEVKTIGDSFMIACKDAHKAVLLARDLQTKFVKYEWDPEIDDAYYTIDTRKGDDAPPSFKLNADEYAALWNGIRVRVGIHTGLSDIRCDDVTGGYDYYGETSNMAARTEAIANGGQVVMTENTYWALSRQEREELDITNLGPQGLRGVPYAVVMYQLNAVAGRSYAPLRTEIEAILPDDGLDDDGNSQATDALLSSAGTLTGPAAAISAVLANCFSPYPAAERIRQIQPLLQKWSIPVPPRNRRISEEDYCQGLLNRLAIRVSLIVQRRQQTEGDGSGVFSGTIPLPKNSITASRPGSRRSVTSKSGRSQSRLFNIQAVERLAELSPQHRMSVTAQDVTVDSGSEDASALKPSPSPHNRRGWAPKRNPLAVPAGEVNDVFKSNPSSPRNAEL